MTRSGRSIPEFRPSQSQVVSTVWRWPGGGGSHRPPEETIDCFRPEDRRQAGDLEGFDGAAAKVFITMGAPSRWGLRPQTPPDRVSGLWRGPAAAFPTERRCPSKPQRELLSGGRAREVATTACVPPGFGAAAATHGVAADLPGSGFGVGARNGASSPAERRSGLRAPRLEWSDDPSRLRAEDWSQKPIASLAP